MSNPSRRLVLSCPLRIALGWLVCILWTAVQAQPEEAPVQRLKLAMLFAEDGTTRPVELPDSWNRIGRSGIWEYRLSFDAPSERAGPWALYVPRVGNRASVHLNGHLIGQLGRFESDLSDHAQRPHFFFIPSDILVDAGNELRLAVQGERARYAGLSDVLVGPVDAVRPHFIWREVAQVWGSFAIILVSIVFGIIAAGFALRTRDRSFAIFLGACLFCAVRTSWAVVTHPPVDYRLWATITDGSYAAYLACLCLFCVEVLQLRRRWITVATGTLLIATVILLVAYCWGRHAMARQVLLALMVAYALALCVTIIHHWYLNRSQESTYLAVAGALSLALALHDHIVVFYTSSGYATFALARYSLLLFVIAMGWLLLQRHVRQQMQEMQLRHDIGLELQRRRAELEGHFDRQQLLAAQDVQQRERQRLLQDLHDGMGLQLNGLLGIVQSGPLERQELTREVQTAIEQMRMLLDSTDGFEGDVSILIGHIRYRVERRLQRQGVAVAWNVALAKPQRVLRPQNGIALQRLVFELVTNTLKHANARHVNFTATDDTGPYGELRIIYEDDGQGFAPDNGGSGVGTISIRRRVDDLGARFDLRSHPGGGVRYELALPVTAFEPASEQQDQASTNVSPIDSGLPRTG